MNEIGASLESLKGWGGWGLFILALIWWIRGMPDRRRAGSDAKKTEAEADRIDMETEDIRIASLERQIKRLDGRVAILEQEIEECHKDRDLALAAARFLWDRLSIAAPGDPAVERLREYIEAPPPFAVSRDMKRSLDKLGESE